jgi:hypothetical protein
MTYLTAPVANNPGEYAIAGLNDDTGWFVYDDVAEDIGFIITGTWVGTITLQVSNQTDFVKTRIAPPIATYTTNQESLNIPREVGRFFRFIFTAYTSGTAYIGLTKGQLMNGQLVDLSTQGRRTGGN